MTFHSAKQVVSEIRDCLKVETQNAVANRLGVNQGYLSRVLAGKRGLSKVLLRQMGFDPTPHYRKKD